MFSCYHLSLGGIKMAEKKGGNIVEPVISQGWRGHRGIKECPSFTGSSFSFPYVVIGCNSRSPDAALSQHFWCETERGLPFLVSSGMKRIET